METTKIKIESKSNLLVIFLGFTIIILGLEYSLYYFESRRIINEEIQNLKSIGEIELNNITNYEQYLKDEGELIVSSSDFTQLLPKFINNPNDATSKKEVKEYLSEKVKEIKSVDAFVLDVSGKKLFSLIDTSGSKLTAMELIEKNRLRNKITITNIDFSNEIFLPYLEFIIIVRKDNNINERAIGYVVFKIDVRENLFKNVNVWTKIKSSYEALFLKSSGNEIIYLNTPRYLSSQPTKYVVAMGAEEIPGSKISLNQKGIAEGFDYRGEKVIAYIDFIPSLDIYLVIKIDKKEVLAQTDRILYILAGSIILVLFLFILIFNLLWKREGVEKIKKELEIQRKEQILTKKYQILSKYANDAFILINKDGRIVEVNDKAVDMYGYSQREFKDLPVNMLRPPELREEIEPFLKEMSSSADGLVYETIHMKKNGRKFPVEISAKLIIIENEILIVGIFRNIEERKRAERIVQESEIKFRSLFENANDAIFLLKDYKFTDCNSKALQLLEVTKEEVCGKTPADFSPEFQINGELSKEHFITKINEALNGTTGIFEWRHKSLSGKLIDCEVSLSALEINHEMYIQAIVRDITEKKQQLNQMLKLTEAVQNTAEMLIITDVDGHIDYVNPAFEKTTGYRLEEIRGLKPNILKSGFHTQEFYKDLWDTILSGESWQGIMFNKKKSGEIYTEEIVISPIKDDKQKIISFVAIKRDVTDRIKAEEELTKAKVKAEVSDRIKSNFLSMMSHEVRTPLNVILGFIDIIRVSIPKDVFPEKEHFFETIQRNSKRLMNLIDDMIDISRIESNEMKLNFEAKNVQSMLMSITSDFELDIKAKGLKLEEEYAEEPIYINVDELRFSQIMTNLITNAIKFTIKGKIKVTAHRKDNEVQISVQDTGIGIPDEFKPYLFEFFRQAEEGYKRNYEGAGLGLAISAKLVKLMNGRIEVESQINKGSTFTITFPVYESISKTSEKISAEISAEIKPKAFSTPPNILIVEDNEDNNYFIEVILDKLGLTHTTVKTANEALDLMKKQKFHLVLMDISLLGDINGEQALDLIRSNSQYNDIPVVAMTAYALPTDREKFIKRGFSDYMAKPFTIEQLTNILFRLLRGN